MAEILGEDFIDPNLCKYQALNNGTYLSTRILTHRGTTIAFALGRKSDGSSLFFDYSILNATADELSAGAEKTAQVIERLDSQCWFENPKSLYFPSEVRVVGEEAVPVYELPVVDRTGRHIPGASRESTDRLDPWLSTSLCLMDPNVNHFEVFSDGKYIYLFRQSRPKSDPVTDVINQAAGNYPIDSNLLCDRFSLVGSTLNRTLEVRYRRSRQKRLPLNDKDTLAVRDINDIAFYEPTFSLRFIQSAGIFTVLQTPTMTNGLLRWMIFALSPKSQQIECFTTEVSSDGLFDIQGQVYYTCTATNHDEVFSNSPGACSAIKTGTGGICGNTKVPIVPNTAISERALKLSASVASPELTFAKTIELSAEPFARGFTIEAWVNPLSYWNVSSKSADTEAGENMAAHDDVANEAPPEGNRDSNLPPAGSSCALISMQSDDAQAFWPSVFLDDNLRLVLRNGAQNEILAKLDNSLKADSWTHVSITYMADTHTLRMTISGSESNSVLYQLPEGTSAGLLQLFPWDSETNQGFQGLVDELRVWNYPLHPSTIKARMSTKATGMEPYLEACWHFDEGTGTKAFDATMNGYDININIKDPKILSDAVWVPSTAPILGNFGLARKTVRLESAIAIRGGLGASVYYEQVKVTQDQESAETPTKDVSTAKPFKRSARLALSFVICTSEDSDCRLAVLDFALMYDGTLSHWPATLILPRLSLSEPRGGARKFASTALLYVDAQGMEIFGGILAFDAARCSTEAPFVWDSSTGSITIFFRNSANVFSALTYDASRSIVGNNLTSLSGHSKVLATSKLRQNQKITIKTYKCGWAPEKVSVHCLIVATMPDGKEVSERWRGVPSCLEDFCNLLSGVNNSQPALIGKMSYLEKAVVADGEQELKGYKVVLLEPLTRRVLESECVNIGTRCFQVLEGANAGDGNVVISQAYINTVAGSPPPQKEDKVYSLGYDYDNLVVCEGKARGDFSKGSSIINLVPMRPEDDVASLKESAFINAGAESLLSSQGQSPFFSSPVSSRALQSSSGKVYSMFESAETTSSDPGITIESWIKVNKVTESVLVAYSSERMPRNEGSAPEHQSFVLAIPATSNDNADYELVGNANGMLFSVRKPQTLQPNRWVHFACSLYNTLALRFSGSNYVDLGTAVEFNISDFTLVFTLQIDEVGQDQIIFAKSAAENSSSPLNLKLTATGELSIAFWAADEDGSGANERRVNSPDDKPLVAGEPYKIFISRKLAQVKRTNATPRSVQLVTMKAWRGDDSVVFDLSPPTMEVLEAAANNDDEDVFSTSPVQACSSLRGNEEPLSLGGAPWSIDQGLKGTIGPVRLYSDAISLPKSATVLCGAGKERSMIGLWSFRSNETTAMIDDLGRNHGKLKREPAWVVSPYKPDHYLSVFINGSRADTKPVTESALLKAPAGPHQLTLGNSIHGDDDTRYFILPNDFEGEFDELRIWNIPRTRENICDTMNSRLSEAPAELAVYLPFDTLEVETKTSTEDTEDAGVTIGVLSDATVNCWHLSPVFDFQTLVTISRAPIGYDASCVQHALLDGQGGQALYGPPIFSSPSVTEYGDLQVSANSGMEGSYKRGYSSIDSNGQWCLNTGFRIGALLTEWVSQVQTSPTLIGYIEGAPPIPIENFVRAETRPASAIRFSNAQRCTYQYGLRSETGTDTDISANAGGGAKWDVAAGIAVMSQVTAGEVKATVKSKIDISDAQFQNNTTSAMTNTNLEMRVELSGDWTSSSSPSGPRDIYKPANTGLALVESEVADIFALRLKMRGPVAPLVAYQMRPNPDIPKDRNLVSFEINKSYSKQGCLDGRNGLQADDDYPPSSEAPKDASYFKPIEAYALKDRIRRAQEQLAGEYERYQLNATNGSKELPQRTSRNICNSYVWTADGGTFQETNSTMDFIQSEIGGNNSLSSALGTGVDTEVTGGGAMIVANFDALHAVRTNLMQTKEKSSDSSFELLAEMPPAVEIRYMDENKKWIKRPGAVDAYRWMSFWLEPSVEATDYFFRKVVDPLWLEQSAEPNAQLLLELRDSLKKQTGNARTKAWRVLHRVTYVSRVLEEIPATKPSARAGLPGQGEKKKGQLLTDVSCNWLMLQSLEPMVRGAESRTEVGVLLKNSNAGQLYPRMNINKQYYSQMIDLLAEYLGVD